MNSTLPPTGNRTYEVLLKWAPAIILIITALLYVKALFGDFNLFDDYQFVVKNASVQDFSADGIRKIFGTFSAGKYQPFTTLSFALEYHFFGFNPLPFHLTNVLLHLISTFVVFKVAEKLSASRVTAIAVSLLFGIHPMHVECVAWISERKDMLYTPFYLLSILAYLRYMDMGYRFKYFVPVFVLFLFSLFSKTEAVTLPLVLLLVDVYKGRKTSAKTIVEKLPLLAFSLFFGILGVLSQQTDGVIGHHAAEPYTFIDHVFLFTSVPAFYVVKLFAPFHLSSMHFYPHLQGGLLPWMYYASLPFVLCVAWLAVRRSPLRKEKIFGVSFFLVTIYIMPQIIYTGPSLTPERYSYIPYIGFFYIIGQWITMNQSAKWRKPLLLVYASVMILFSVLTWLRIDTWKTSKALFADMIAKNDDAPDCAYFYMVLGNSSLDEKDYNQAIEDYGHVIAQHKDNVLAYVQRGTAYSELGNANAGIADFSEAIRLDPNHPMYYYNRASLRAGMGDINGAVEDYTSCLKIDGTNSDAYTFRGALRMRANDSIGACEDWKRGAMLGSSKAKALSDRICH